MARTRLIYRLITVFLVFALMITVPFVYTFVTQAKKIIYAEGKQSVAGAVGYEKTIGELSAALLEPTVPYIFYIFVMAMMFSVFFSRKLLASIRELQRGADAIRDGDFDIRLSAQGEDELAGVIGSFNKMTDYLSRITADLQKKDLYLNAMTDPLCVVDDGGRIVDINHAFAALFEYKKEDLLGSPISSIIDGRLHAAGASGSDASFDRTSSYEIEVITRYGSKIPALTSESPILLGSEAMGRIFVFRDFREYKELREELQRSKEYIETVIDSIDDQILVIDRDYKIVSANKMALDHFSGQVIGCSCHSVAHNSPSPCWTEGLDCPVRTVFASGENSRITHRHTISGGQTRFHEIVASPIKDNSGRVVQVIELIRDVTDRLKHEDEIFLKNRELTTLNSISGILSRSLRPDEIFSAVLDKMIEMMKMSGGGIFFIDEQRKDIECRYHKGISDEYVKKLGRIKLGVDIPGMVASSGQAVTTGDISSDPLIGNSMMKHSGMKGYCCIPIRGKERTIGVFCLFSFNPHMFTGDEENILISIGEMTGMALENIRLYENLSRLYDTQKRRRDEEQRQLLSLTSKLGSTVDLREVMGSVMQILKGNFGADFAWLLQREKNDSFVMKASSSPADVEDRVVIEGGKASIEGWSLKMATPLVIQDISSEDGCFIPSEISSSSYKSVVSVPMRVADRALGAFSLYYSGRRIFDDEELHFLMIIANMLAVSLERYRYHTELVKEKGLSDAVLQSVSDRIVTVDMSGRIISMNKAFERMIGVSPSDGAGMLLSDAISFGPGNYALDVTLKECLDGALSGRSSSGETEVMSLDKKPMSLRIDSAPVVGPEGRISGVVSVIRDISREKEVDKMKTDIIRLVSHEFRTPLAAIVGMTEMVLEGDIEQARQRQYLQTVLNEGNRLSHMVSDLLSIARIESGMEKLKPDDVDLKSFFDDLLSSIVTEIERKDAVVSYDISGVSTVRADAPKLKQVMLNIIDNSLAFSDRGCHVEINVEKSDNSIEIRVRDDGWGIPQSDMPHLGERFFRGSHGEKIKGTGLGLFICGEILRLHGGTLKIESSPGSGTVVSIYLPYTESK